jgi:hypothetical protein
MGLKAYLVFVAALMLGSFFYELHMTEYYKPSLEDLQSTTLSTGKLEFIYKRYAEGPIPRVNGISLDCHLYFGGSAGKCPDSVARLAPGTEVTVSIAQLFSTYYLRSMPMSITVRGVQMYAVTPEQVIQDYLRRSRRSLPLFPFIFFGVLVLAPLSHEGFRHSLLGLFSS